VSIPWRFNQSNRHGFCLSNKKRLISCSKIEIIKMSRKNNTKLDQTITENDVELSELRDAIREEYQAVANEPQKGFRFHTGRPLARILGYDEDWLQGIPQASIESFAGTGNPFSLGEIKPDETVVDVGCGAGLWYARNGGRAIEAEFDELISRFFSPNLFGRLPIIPCIF
jgi:hypothetical protein